MSSFTRESFRQLLREEGIQDTPLASNPPVLQSIANKVCEWKQLARFLGLDEPTIKTIEWNYSGDYTEQKFQALNTWTRQNGRDATLVNLLRVIYCDLNNRLLVEEIAQIQRNTFNEKDFNSYVAGIKDGPLDNFNIQVVTNHVIEWEELSRYLKLSDPEVEIIKRSYPKNYKEQKFQCVKCWVKNNGRDATLINLLQQIYYNLKDKTMVMGIVDDLKHGSKRSGDLDTENTSDMDKPLLMYKDLDKPLVMDIAEYRNHASKRSGDYNKENTSEFNQPLPKLKRSSSAPCKDMN